MNTTTPDISPKIDVRITKELELAVARTFVVKNLDQPAALATFDDNILDNPRDVGNALLSAVMSQVLSDQVTALLTVAPASEEVPTAASRTPSKSMVFCRLQVDATHNWPACEVPGVGFLKHPHRHMFHIEAHFNVTHDDRDIEFIAMKRKIAAFFAEAADEFGQVNLGHMSCEMIGQELIDQFGCSMVIVSEDGENGAVVFALP